MTQRRYCGIIPARYASTRFPGKPLTMILGKPMFWHVYTRAKRCSLLTDVVLATDDERIALAAEELAVPFVYTASDHQSGSDRVYEAALKLGLSSDTVVVNIQGDEPALDPAHIACLLTPFFNDPEVRVTTLAYPVQTSAVENPNRVKVALAVNNDALYFSRSPIPYMRNARPDSGDAVYFGHIGLYAYTLVTLGVFTGLSQSPLELVEGLEQLRFLENNIPIKVAIVAEPSQAVDVPEDVARVEQILLSENNGNLN